MIHMKCKKQKEDLKEKIDKGMKLKDIAAELNVSNGKNFIIILLNNKLKI